MKVFKRFLMTDPTDYAILILRVALGVMIWPHGAQKLLGWFGGPGFEGAAGFVTAQQVALGVPEDVAYVLAVLVIIGEFFGGIGLVLGLFGRLDGFALMLIMIGAIFTVHLNFGFFFNNPAGVGYEFHMVTAAAAALIMIKGSGALSLDNVLLQRLR